MLKKIIESKIDKFMSNYEDLNSDTNFDNFQFYTNNQILNKFEIDLDQILDGDIDGGGDNGIDGIYFFVDNKCITDFEEFERLFNINNSTISIKIFQNKKESGFKETTLLKIDNGLKNIFNLEKDLVGNEDFIRKSKLLREICIFWHESENKKEIEFDIYYITLGNKEDISETLHTKENEIKNYLIGEAGIKNFNFHYIGQKEIFEAENKKSYTKTLNIKGKMDYDYNDEVKEAFDGVIAIVDGYDFYNFLINQNGELEEYIFETNVRDFEGKNKKVVESIGNTIVSDNSKNFWCMNNGITILTSSLKSKSNSITLNDYNIINGCQTSHSIFNKIKSNPGKIQKFDLIVKIISAKEDFENPNILEVIKATNSQISIDETAIMSQSIFHKGLEEYFKSGSLIFYYEVRNNYYRRQGKAINKIINPKKLFQLVRSSYYQKPSSSRTSPTELYLKEHTIYFDEHNNLFYYKFITLLHFKIFILLRLFKKKKNISKEYLEIINNGNLHILRIFLSLLLNSNKKLSLLDKHTKKNILFSNKSDFIKQVSEMDYSNSNFQNSMKILILIVKKYKKDNNVSGSISNILKKDSFDRDYINPIMDNYFKKKIEN